MAASVSNFIMERFDENNHRTGYVLTEGKQTVTLGILGYTIQRLGVDGIKICITSVLSSVSVVL